MPTPTRPSANESTLASFSPVWQAERNSSRGRWAANAAAKSPRPTFSSSPPGPSRARIGSAPPLPWQDRCKASSEPSPCQMARNSSRLPLSSTTRSRPARSVARRIARSFAVEIEHRLADGCGGHGHNSEPVLPVRRQRLGMRTDPPHRRPHRGPPVGRGRPSPSAASSHGTSRNSRACASGRAADRKTCDHRRVRGVAQPFEPAFRLPVEPVMDLPARDRAGGFRCAAARKYRGSCAPTGETAPNPRRQAAVARRRGSARRRRGGIQSRALACHVSPPLRKHLLEGIGVPLDERQCVLRDGCFAASSG